MSESQSYLRELRRALPLGCRRRFVAEVREHFASAVAAEAERGVGAVEAERLTIERLGPAQTLADQLLADSRSGALGRRGRWAAALTTGRLIALVAVASIGVVVGAVFAGTRSSPAPPPPPQRAAVPAGMWVPKQVYVGTLLATVQARVQARYPPRQRAYVPAPG